MVSYFERVGIECCEVRRGAESTRWTVRSRLQTHEDLIGRRACWVVVVPRAHLQAFVLQLLGPAWVLRRVLRSRLGSLAPLMTLRWMMLISLPTGALCGLMGAIVLAHGQVRSGVRSRRATMARACLSLRTPLGRRVARAHDRCLVRWLWVRGPVAWVERRSIRAMRRRACRW